jgi:hypothetical protein
MKRPKRKPELSVSYLLLLVELYIIIIILFIFDI